VPDRVDAAVDGDQPADRDPVLDRPRSEAEVQQLLSGDVPVLRPGKGRYRLVD